MSLEQLVELIKKAPVASGMPVKIVAIDGHGGAGKSTLAEKLANKLGAQIIQVDDFATWDDWAGMKSRLVNDVLEPVKRGAKAISYKRSSWWPDHHPEPVVDQPVTPIMIIEGARSARRDFRPYLSFVIFVDTPKEICLQRGLERDGQDKKELWLKWFAAEDDYIARDHPEQYADAIVKGTS